LSSPEVSQRAPRALYHGWKVVTVAALVALFGWGLGFYGPGVYLVALQERHGWSSAQVSSAVTAYYLLAALMIFIAGATFERHGIRNVVLAGTCAMALGVASLAWIERPWQIYGPFAVMAIGWAAMSNAAINIIIAPWFDNRRGLALSLALTGAGIGGILIVPLLLALIEPFGLPIALYTVVVLMLLVLVPASAAILRPKRTDECDVADEPTGGAGAAAAAPPAAWKLSTILTDADFVTIALPFALGLTVQVGILTHQVSILLPVAGTAGTSLAVAITVLTAFAARIITGFFVDRLDRRFVACGNFLLQAVAMPLFMFTTPVSLYLACALLGTSVGNMVALPGLILQNEFPKEHFARAVSLVLAICNFTYAFGPSLLGVLKTTSGSYNNALLICCAIQVLAALVVLVPRLRSGVRPSARSRRS
jgi:MFS family permease